MHAIDVASTRFATCDPCRNGSQNAKIMRVLFVRDSDYPWDIRVEKICMSLIKDGCEVHLICRNRLRRPMEEVLDGLHIHRIRCLPVSYGDLNGVFTFPAFFNPNWLWRINQILRREKFDLIIVRDLPMALAAIAMGELNRVPVVLDMAESYPEMIRLVWKYEPFKVANLFARNPYIVDVIENVVLRRVSHVFAMVEESRDRLIAKGVPGSKITIVSNTPVPGRFENANSTVAGEPPNSAGRLVLIYVGFVNYSRGLQNALLSLREFAKVNSNFQLMILGKGNAEAYLKRMVAELGLKEHVDFLGWIDNREIAGFIAAADVCIVPHPPSGHWDNTIPNKLFDYMAVGKPVLVSNVRPMKRIVDELRCGLVYEDGNAASFVSQLSRLGDEAYRRELGQNGRAAIAAKYNWTEDSLQMLNALRKLVPS